MPGKAGIVPSKSIFSVPVETPLNCDSTTTSDAPGVFSARCLTARVPGFSKTTAALRIGVPSPDTGCLLLPMSS